MYNARIVSVQLGSHLGWRDRRRTPPDRRSARPTPSSVNRRRTQAFRPGQQGWGK